MHECLSERINWTHIQIIYLSGKKGGGWVTNQWLIKKSFIWLLDMEVTWEEGLKDVPSGGHD
jgi:hypothetical protein